MKKQLEKISILSLSLMLVSTFSPSSALPQMIAFFKAQGIKASQVEFLFSLSSFAVLVILLLTPLLDRFFSEKTMIILGLLLIAFGGSMPLFAQKYYLVYLSRIILGFGIGFINARAISIISENYRGAERMQMLGIRGSVEILGNAVLTAIVGLVLSFGWSTAFAIYLFALPILIFYLLYAPTNAPKKVLKVAKISKASFTKRELAIVIALALLAGFAINVNSANTLRIPTLITSLGLGSASQASFILSIMMLMGIVAGICFGGLLKRFRIYLIVLSLIFLACGLTLIAFAQNLFVLSLGAMISGFLYSIIVTTTFSLASEVVEESKIASATTLILVFCLLGGASVSYVLELLDIITPSYVAQIVYAMISLLLAIVVFIGQAFLTYRKRCCLKK
ncbi:MFS transporter [Streptococcus sciuri]|uniref:MFS transporter n=1 Tax=Streptococcus sciuri TaxID=2973939 RepID=A0ABT2F7J0_9STRE|nr:MFS transporter [Streptococcus sciuri]MCS4488432.1 MFS transporter [Streptococcus sciuri]